MFITKYTRHPIQRASSLGDFSAIRGRDDPSLVHEGLTEGDRSGVSVTSILILTLDHIQEINPAMPFIYLTAGMTEYIITLKGIRKRIKGGDKQNKPQTK